MQTRERLTVNVDPCIIDQFRNLVFWSPGLTLAEAAEEALKDYVARQERERGQSFPQRRSELKTGRPIR